MTRGTSPQTPKRGHSASPHSAPESCGLGFESQFFDCQKRKGEREGFVTALGSHLWQNHPDCWEMPVPTGSVLGDRGVVFDLSVASKQCPSTGGLGMGAGWCWGIGKLLVGAITCSELFFPSL